MSAVVRIPAPLRAYAAGARELAVDAATVGEALAYLVARYPQLGRHLLHDDGTLRGFVNVYVNDEDVRVLGGPGAPIGSNDTVTIVPSVAGGSAAPGADYATAEPTLSEDELLRYSRHLLMPEVGLRGQQKLRASRVLLVGAGGLGSPAALYLAAAGVGTLGLVDFDTVDVTNLQRQVLYGTRDLGRSKAEAGAERLRDLNPHVRVVPMAARLTSANAVDVVRDFDVVVDGSDNFPTRYLVSDACVLCRVPCVFASVFRLEGQVTVFDSTRGPCYRCLFREPPPAGLLPNCAEGGVLGVLPGLVGSAQALEAIKLLLGVGEPLLGRLLLVDALTLRWRELRVHKDPGCPACGTSPSIHAPIAGHESCDPSGAADGDLAEITPAELLARLERGDDVRLVDVREPHEWEIANLGRYGALRLPLGELPDRLHELDRSHEIVLYCRGGSRSARAFRQLRGAGFQRVWNLKGGIDAWAREVDGSVPRY